MPRCRLTCLFPRRDDVHTVDEVSDCCRAIGKEVNDYRLVLRSERNCLILASWIESVAYNCLWAQSWRTVETELMC